MDFYNFLCVCLLCVGLHVVSASHRSTDCSNSFTKSTVKLPSHRQLLSLDDFNRYVVDQSTFAVLYGIIPKQAATTQPPTPIYSTNLVFSRTSNILYNAQYTITSANAEGAADCNLVIDFPLQTDVGCDRAMFNNIQVPTSRIMFWSSCPSEYIMVFICFDGVSSIPRNERKCPIENVEIYVLLPRNPADGAPNDVPIYEIVKYLKRVTDIKFGSDTFNWMYLFGESAAAACE